MTYSRVESPSALAVEAMVSGVPAFETLPRTAPPGTVDVAFPPANLPPDLV